MIRITSYAGRRVAVVGLARSGLAAARALAAGGAEVVAWDDGERSRERAAAEGIPVADLRRTGWQGIAALVLAPGIPLTHPKPHWSVEAARAAGVPVIGDTTLFFRELALQPKGGRPKVIGITGTNGKSTTTALTAHLLRAAGKRVAMGGNIGEAVLGLAPFDEVDVYVLELSSYQIDLTWRPEDGIDPGIGCDVGVLLNLSPDHLDRHGGMEHYAAVKERLVAHSRVPLVGVDDPSARAIAMRHLRTGTSGQALHIESDATRSASAVTPEDLQPLKNAGVLLSYTAADAQRLATPVLRGPHNLQNIAAATRASICLLGSGPAAMEALQAGLASFPGLAHRMELIGRVGETAYVNDSKATNADSTVKALASFDDILWILGGRPKEGGIESLRPFFGRVRRAFLIGEASESFAATLASEVPHEACGTLESAVQRVADVAGNGPATVLLSPACASFDQFKDFEDRGEQFRAFCRALPGFAPFDAKLP